MKYSRFIIILFLPIFNLLHPQIPEYSKLYGAIGPEIESGGNIIQTSKQTYLYCANSGVAFVLNINNDGKLIWSKRYIMPNVTVRANKMIELKDGNLLIIGNYIDYLAKTQLGLLINTDLNGNVNWAKSFKDGSDFIDLNNVYHDKDSELIISGYAEIFGTTQSEAITLKLDYNGSLVSSQRWQMGKYINRIYTVKPFRDSMILLSGLSYENEPNEQSAFMGLFFENGRTVWSNKYGFTSGNKNAIYDFDIISDGIFATTEHGIIQLDFDGSVLWQKLYESFVKACKISCNPIELKKTQDNNYLVTTGGSFFGNLTHKIDTNGTILWSYFLKLNGATGLETFDHSYIYAGYGPLQGALLSSPVAEIGVIKANFPSNEIDCTSENMPLTYSDTVVSKPFTVSYRSSGEILDVSIKEELIHFFEGDQCINISSNKNNIYRSSIAITPQPVQERLRFLTEFNLDKTKFFIYTLQGKEIMQGLMHNNTSGIDIQELNSGIYILKLNVDRLGYVLKFVKI